MRTRKLDRELGKHNPARAFESPDAVVGEILMTRGEKLATLERWRLEIMMQLDSAGEGMATRGFSKDRLLLLEKIERAKKKLQA